MNASCLEFCLTDDEQSQFERDGFLIVPNALSPPAIDRLVAAVDRIDGEQRAEQRPDALLSVTDIVHCDESFLDLIDLPAIFPKVWGILGWNIYLYHSHMDVTPPTDLESTAPQVAWHQDSMRVNDEIETHPRPRLSLKVGFYLSDVSRPESGNTLIVPGSHLFDEIDCPADGVSSPAGAVPLCVEPGSAVLIDRRIWHSRSTNASALTRKVVWLGYSYRWLRAKDEMTVQHLYEQLDPIQRQILGDGLSANGVYDPVAGDVPLRGWLEKHRPQDAGKTKHKQPQARSPAMMRGKDLESR